MPRHFMLLKDFYLIVGIHQIGGTRFEFVDFKISKLNQEID
jgi:hypothetical protein